MCSTYASSDEKKLEQAEWDSHVKTVLRKTKPLQFHSYLTLTDNHQLVLSELFFHVNRMLTLFEEPVVLDIGGGDGYILRQASHLSKKGVVLDISKNQLKLGKSRRGSATLDFVLADADFCPFRMRSFDIVIAVGFLHHCAPKHEMVIAKLKSLLKRSGRLLVVEGVTFKPEVSVLSFLLFYYPFYILKAIGLLFCVLSFHETPLRFRRKHSCNVLSGDQKARIHPLHRTQFFNLLSKHFMVSQIRYHLWLSAFVLDALGKIKEERIRARLIKLFLPQCKILDTAFCQSRFGKYGHIYSISLSR